MSAHRHKWFPLNEEPTPLFDGSTYVGFKVTWICRCGQIEEVEYER